MRRFWFDQHFFFLDLDENIPFVIGRVDDDTHFLSDADAQLFTRKLRLSLQDGRICCWRSILGQTSREHSSQVLRKTSEYSEGMVRGSL